MTRMREAIDSLLKSIGGPLMGCIAVTALLFGLSLSLPLWAAGEWGVLQAVALALVFAAASLAVFLGIVAVGRRIRFRVDRSRGIAFSRTKLFVLICFCVIWLNCLITLLSAYPGYCSTDSMVIINQAVGNFDPNDMFVRDGLTNHQPVFYTGLVALVAFFFGGEGSETMVFCFLLIQSAAFSFMCAWAIGWLNRHGCGRVLLIVILAIIAFLPVFSIHAVTLWKDGPFSALLVVFAFCLYDVATRKTAIVKRDLVVLGILAILVSLLRNNGIFIVAASLLYLVIVMPSVRKGLAVCLAAVVCAILVVQGPLFALIGVQPSKFAESVGVPLQQIALISIEDGLDEDQSEFVDRIIPVEKMNEVYLPISSNPIKFDSDFNNAYLEAHKGEFLLMWFKIVAAHPATALKAWVLQTEGIWGAGQIADVGVSSTYNGADTVDLLGWGWNPRGLYNKLQSMFPYLLGKGAMVWGTAWLSLLALALGGGSRLRRASVFVPGFVMFATLMIAIPSGWDYRYVFYFTLFLPYALFFVADAMRTVAVDDGVADPHVDADRIGIS